jgi:4-amino-4-deoxy-L-arabinose transferase-like glycosyltransferase
MPVMAVRKGVPDRLVPVVTWRWFPHCSLFALALVLRVAWVVEVERSGRWALNDALIYHANAASLVEGNGFRPLGVGPTAQWPPGYSTVLAGLYRVFGIDPLVGELFNAVVGAVTVVLLMLFVERALDRPTAVVAGTIMCVLPGPILWTDVLVTETLFTMVFVALFVVLSRAVPTWRWLVAIGVIIGVGGLVRGEALTWGLLPIVAFWRDLPRIDLLRRVAAIAGVVVVVLSPWTIRNAVVMDAFVPVATNASQTLWSGHHAGATGGQTYPPESYYQQFDQAAPLRELQSSRALRNDALEYMFTHPVRELELIPLKLIHLNRGDSYALDWVNDAPDGAPIPEIDVERFGVLADAAYYAVLALTLLGAFVLGRSFWGTRSGRLLAASFLTALFLYGFLYYGNYRYRVPYEPLMVVVAATVLTRLWSRRRAWTAPLA